MANLSNSDADGILGALIPRWLTDDGAWFSMFVHHNPVLMKFLLSGAIQTGGFGRFIRVPVRIPRVTGPHMETVSDSLAEVSTQFIPGKTAADFYPTFKRMDWSLDKVELKKFGSETEMVQWAQGDVEDSMDTYMADLENEMWAAEETANSGGGSATRLGSLRTYINSAGTSATDGGANPPALAEQSVAGFVGTTGAAAVTSIGSLDRATTYGAYWTPPVRNPGSSQAFSILELSKVYSLARINGESPGLIVTTRAIWDAIQNLASLGGSNGGQLQNSSKLADIGFNAVKFLDADVVYDDRVPTAGFESGTSTAKVHNIFCINPKYIGLRMDAKKPPFRKVDDARPIVRFVGEHMLQLVMKGSGRYHSRHINVTAP
jgi:hypothetical protein